MTLGSALIIVLVQRYLRGLLDPTVSLLEVHKLLYFMQEAGEPLRLKYEKRIMALMHKICGMCSMRLRATLSLVMPMVEMHLKKSYG